MVTWLCAVRLFLTNLSMDLYPSQEMCHDLSSLWDEWRFWQPGHISVQVYHSAQRCWSKNDILDTIVNPLSTYKPLYIDFPLCLFYF